MNNEENNEVINNVEETGVKQTPVNEVVQEEVPMATVEETSVPETTEEPEVETSTESSSEVAEEPVPTEVPTETPEITEETTTVEPEVQTESVENTKVETPIESNSEVVEEPVPTEVPTKTPEAEETPTVEPEVQTESIENTEVKTPVESSTENVSEPVPPETSAEEVTTQPILEPTIANVSEDNQTETNENILEVPNEINSTPEVGNAPTIEDIPDNSKLEVNTESTPTEVEPSVEQTTEIEKLDPTQKIASAEEIQEAANVKIEEKPKGEPNGFKRFMAVIIFLVFFALVFFMPEVTRFINDWRASSQPVQKITDGVSTCILSKTTENLDVNITTEFTITNSKLRKLNYITVSKGDAEEDKEELTKLKDECLTLKQEAGELKGVSISCSLNGDTTTNRQLLDYELMDVKQVTSAYTEAGDIYPEFTKGEDIDKIEGKMQQAGYKCSRK